MENQPGWHGVAPNDEQATRALLELGVGADEVTEMIAADK